MAEIQDFNPCKYCESDHCLVRCTHNQPDCPECHGEYDENLCLECDEVFGTNEDCETCQGSGLNCESENESQYDDNEDSPYLPDGIDLLSFERLDSGFDSDHLASNIQNSLNSPQAHS